MEYISAEEFLKQPKEVQQVFVNWANLNVNDYDLVLMNEKVILYIDFRNRDNEFLSCDSLPLFTEGQLRKFIEDKTERRINEITYYEGTGYDITLEYFDGLYEDLGTDLLQAYWKVALAVAKE